MIEKLSYKDIVYWLNGEKNVETEAPSNEELMEKINEIIDAVNYLMVHDDDLR